MSTHRADDGQFVFGSARNPETDAESVWIASVSLPGCGSADFNGDGDNGTDLDIESFFGCLAGDCCGMCINADINTDGAINEADIEAFFRVLAGSSC